MKITFFGTTTLLFDDGTDQILFDVLFLGVAGLQRASPEIEVAFYRETIDKLSPKLVIPIHWDNFFPR